MKMHFPRLITAALVAACLVSGVGCYPYASYYNPTAYQHNANGYSDAKGYSVPQETAPAPPQRPHYAGVDPGLVVAGVAAAGLLGYAIGNNHGYHGYYGPGYYRPVHYGYYGPHYYH